MDLTDKGTIYVLRHSSTGEIRYVGQTQQTLKTRLYQHTRNVDKPVGRWIMELKSCGFEPVIDPLEVVDRHRLDERELYYKRKFEAAGLNLLNVLDVGQGRKGYRPPKQVREAISASVKKWWVDLDEQTKEQLIAGFIKHKADWRGRKHTSRAKTRMSKSAERR